MTPVLINHSPNNSALKYRGPGSQPSQSSQQSLAHRPGVGVSSNGKKVSSVSERLAAKRAAALEPVRNTNRARPAGMPVSYTIAPISQVGSGSGGQDHRPVGAGSMEAFRKITQGKKKNN